MTDCYAWDMSQLCEASRYYLNGFSTLQLALDTAIHSVRSVHCICISLFCVRITFCSYVESHGFVNVKSLSTLPRISSSAWSHSLKTLVLYKSCIYLFIYLMCANVPKARF